MVAVDYWRLAEVCLKLQQNIQNQKRTKSQSKFDTWNYSRSERIISGAYERLRAIDSTMYSPHHTCDRSNYHRSECNYSFLIPQFSRIISHLPKRMLYLRERAYVLSIVLILEWSYESVAEARLAHPESPLCPFRPTQPKHGHIETAGDWWWVLVHVGGGAWCWRTWHGLGWNYKLLALLIFIIWMLGELGVVWFKFVYEFNNWLKLLFRCYWTFFSYIMLLTSQENCNWLKLQNKEKIYLFVLTTNCI